MKFTSSLMVHVYRPENQKPVKCRSETVIHKAWKALVYSLYVSGGVLLSVVENVSGRFLDLGKLNMIYFRYSICYFSVMIDKEWPFSTVTVECIFFLTQITVFVSFVPKKYQVSVPDFVCRTIAVPLPSVTCCPALYCCKSMEEGWVGAL